jgi:hypothetical protein
LLEGEITAVGKPIGGLGKLTVSNNGDFYTVMATEKQFSFGNLEAGRGIRAIGYLIAPVGVVRIIAEHIEVKPQAEKKE